MNAKDIKAPYLPYDKIRPFAEHFLAHHNPEGSIPVPVEHIAELKLGLSITPLPGIARIADVDSWLSENLDEIFIDEEVFDFEPRARFSIAHEIGHIVLHHRIFESLQFNTTDEWKTVMNSIPPREYDFIEQHAYSFAGLIPCSPGQSPYGISERNRSDRRE